jgi:DNA-binding Lrp family transcriptional regulator
MQDIPMTFLTQGQTFCYFRRLVARVLLEYAGDNKTKRRQLTQRDIAILIGTDWKTVHASLKSLHEEGVIRLERLRIILNKDLLQKAAGVAGRI